MQLIAYDKLSKIRIERASYAHTLCITCNNKLHICLRNNEVYYISPIERQNEFNFNFLKKKRKKEKNDILPEELTQNDTTIQPAYIEFY